MVKLARVANDAIVDKLDELQVLLDLEFGVDNYDVSVIINSRLIMQKNNRSVNVVPTVNGISTKSKMLVRENVILFREKI